MLSVFLYVFADYQPVVSGGERMKNFIAIDRQHFGAIADVEIPAVQRQQCGWLLPVACY